MQLPVDVRRLVLVEIDQEVAVAFVDEVESFTPTLAAAERLRHIRDVVFGTSRGRVGWGVAALLLLCALVDCSHQKPLQKDGGNEVARFLAQAERQTETDGQRQEVRRALGDLMTLPASQLSNQRYADYQMRPNQWTLATLLMRYFVAPELHFIDEEALYRDAQAPAAIDAIRAQIRAIDEGRQVVRSP